jgi:predicted DCC family thiol-disulfide oxidoreductase YuxK
LGPIILFDGACNLCTGSVQFIIERDRAAVFRFASLDSATGRRARAEHQLVTDSVVLLEDGKAFVESEAALRIASRLGWPWRWLAAGRVLPLAWRNAVYRWVARNRYAWFGRQDSCWLPTPELAARFLD